MRNTWKIPDSEIGVEIEVCKEEIDFWTDRLSDLKREIERRETFKRLFCVRE
jgi:hypothetical protein